ncbi:outer membrane protein transport protein [uncultured Tateyamaria sp.]|uniref:OmpP1/FadL family transporter n=1 Tax=uncultured Tateyamaria sp. TaxID=455651 RepID=UPI00261B99ED|nr:outer membrane protein transport protein [uncultured Tateyamaria sp.]
MPLEKGLYHPKAHPLDIHSVRHLGGNNMKTRLMTVAALLASTASAHAVGLDRSGQNIGILFEEGNRAQLSFAYTDPTVEGTTQSTFPVPGIAGSPIANVGDSYLTWSGAIKYDFNDRLSFAFIIDEPYGADTFYTESPAASALGGTGATVDSIAYTALARYKFNDNWSVHGGLRYQEVSANVSLGGFAFAPAGANGFNAAFASDGAFGYVVGAAYEIPAIALRVALTYNSKTSHDLPTVETIPGVPVQLSSVTEVDTPESLNLDFQTGIAQNTLLFGTLRYARYSDTEVIPENFGRSLTDLEDGYDFSIGIGRRFNEKWSGSVSVGFTTEGDDDLVSPLAPNNGSQFIAVGAKYDVNEDFAIAGGVRYTFLGDAIAAPGGSTPVADFESNDAISLGLRFEYKF